MRFCILRRSARSDILVQSSLGLAEAEKAEDVPEYLVVVGAAVAYWYPACLCMLGQTGTMARLSQWQ
jgi:hypothetical protein